METLYISQENCYIRMEGEHLNLTRRGEKITSIPLVGIKTLIIFDSVNMSAQALDLLLINGIDVLYMSKWGKLKGRILSVKGGGAVLKLAQHSAFLNADRRMSIAKSIVTAKIHNQTEIVRRYQYNNTIHDYNENLSEIKKFTELLKTADTMDTIMGVEGISAKYYWDCFRRLLKNPIFSRREYRPAPDYVNALLNLGYSFLANEVTTCLIAKNFDLEIGFLHSVHYGRNSLTLDIIEEFRAPFIDAWILTLLNKNQLKDEHFHIMCGDWRLTDEGFHKFCKLFHERVPTWREKFREQSHKLKTALLKGEDYEPYLE
ncbi:CRISPR-associated endonuclease Cas1 [Clostridia bacterium]|nr:CRISPR-associated endonuclease Cas1 [Clostridia bacterium]